MVSLARAVDAWSNHRIRSLWHLFFLRGLPLADESEELPIPDRVIRNIINRCVRVGKN